MKTSLTTLIPLVIASLTLTACGGGGGSSTPQIAKSTEVTVGKKLFFDINLSENSNQSCASCHAPDSGFADPRVTKAAPVSEGSPAGAFGNRNAPTSAYASFIPTFNSNGLATTVETASKYVGGQFLDGRRASLKAQAKDPFLNPVEMNNLNEADVVAKVQNSSYSAEFLDVFGPNAFDDVTAAYDNIATAIAAFESSSEMNPFTSKFDAVMANQETFTDSEQRGFDLFKGNKAKCANCHTVNEPDAAGSLFTDFKYFNVGTPPNSDNPVYTTNATFVDTGLAANPNIDAADITDEEGKFRTPTLRNVELTAPYMHNGRYETLAEVITHYDFTVVDYLDDPGFVSTNFPQRTPEVVTNLAEEVKVRLDLTAQETTDLENFMLTLTDGYF